MLFKKLKQKVERVQIKYKEFIDEGTNFLVKSTYLSFDEKEAFLKLAKDVVI